VIGVGAQDNFDLAQQFVAEGSLDGVDMLWDPSLSTWRAFEVRINSQMMIVDGPLEGTSGLFYGFGASEQTQILEALSDFN